MYVLEPLKEKGTNKIMTAYPFIREVRVFVLEDVNTVVIEFGSVKHLLMLLRLLQKKLSSVPTCLLVRKDEVKQKLQSLTAAAAATSKTSCAAQAQPTAFKPTAVRAPCAALQP